MFRSTLTVALLVSCCLTIANSVIVRYYNEGKPVLLLLHRSLIVCLLD